MSACISLCRCALCCGDLWLPIERCKGEIRKDDDQKAYLIFSCNNKTHLAYSLNVSANGVAGLQPPEHARKKHTLDPTNMWQIIFNLDPSNLGIISAMK